MIETPRIWRKPAAKMNSHTSGRTRAETKRSRWWAKRSASRQTMPVQADQVLPQREAAARGDGGAHAGSSGAGPTRRTEGAAHVGGTRLRDQRRRGRRRPRSGRDAARHTSSSAATSSSRCVAHSTATPRSRDQASGHGVTIADSDATSRPTVGSSSTSRRGRCSSARAISTRRICPPESWRTASRARSASSISCEPASARWPRLAPADAVQGGVIEQVVAHRDVEIERARLEHHAEPAQRLARRARDIDGRARGSSRCACRRAA